MQDIVTLGRARRLMHLDRLDALVSVSLRTVVDDRHGRAALNTTGSTTVDATRWGIRVRAIVAVLLEA